jgi:RNA polymerase sigma-70 factor, ECF subfamily
MSTPTAPDCSPERLMRLLRAGEAGALDQITRCYSDRLLAAGRRHCRTSAEVEDAVQDALVTAAEHLTELRDDHRLEGWLVRVVATACRRISRGHKNSPALHDSAQELESGESDPEERAAQRELARLLERSLLSLSPQDRSILLLAELEGFSSSHIGAELGMTDGAVRVRLSRLRARLAETLQSEIVPSL